MKEIGMWVGMLILFAGVIGATLYGLSKTERYECEKWAAEAKEYPAYYITSWQKAQCDYQNITVDAPVK